MNATDIFDTLGHDWERVYRDDGEPLLKMQCALCGRVWLPHESIRDIGKCSTRAPVARP